MSSVPPKESGQAAARAPDDLVGRLVRERATRFAAPADLVADLAAGEEVEPNLAPGLPARPRNARRAWFGRGGFWWGLGSGALAGALAMSVVVRPGPGTGEAPILMQSFVADHARALAAHSETELADARPGAIAPWLAPVVGSAPPVPSLEAAGYELVGGRRDFAGAQAVGVVVYRRGQHQVDVFVLPEDARVPLVGPQQVGAYAAVAWRTPTLRFCAVSDLSPAELERFRQAFEARTGAAA